MSCTEGFGKQHRFAPKQHTCETSRNTLTTALMLPFRWVGQLLRGQAGDTADLTFRVTLILLILLAFIVRLQLLEIRDFDEDEFQHLHSAYSIYRGMIPYRDYSEYHTPWIHFILRWIYPIWGEDVTAIFMARRLMLVFTGGVLYLTYRLGKVLHSTDAGLLGALFLSYTVMFLEKTLEIRPDTAAVAFWLLALLCFVKGIREQRSCWYLFAGLAMGSSIMFTQKSLFAFAGLGLALLWSYLDRRLEVAFRQNLRLTGMFVIGLALPIGITCLYFLAYRGLYEFINFNFLMTLRWKENIPYNYMLQYIRQNLFISALGCSGLLFATFRLVRQQCVRQGEFVPVISTFMLIVGLYLIPVPYRQYYQLFLPLLSLFAAILILQLADTLNRAALILLRRDAYRRWWLLPIALYLFVTVWGMLWMIRYAHITSAALLFGIACTVLAVVLSPRRMRYALLVFICGTLVQPFNQMMNTFSEGNRWQLSQIRYILDHSEAKDTVLDGWSGYGVFRPHAYFYFFLNDGMLTMLNARQKGQDVIDALERQPTKFIIYDAFVRSLNPEVQTYIQEHYRATGTGDIYERIGSETKENPLHVRGSSSPNSRW